MKTLCVCVCVHIFIYKINMSHTEAFKFTTNVACLEVNTSVLTLDKGRLKS